jgi:hypothetical protein
MQYNEGHIPEEQRKVVKPKLLVTFLPLLSLFPLLNLLSQS